MSVQYVEGDLFDNFHDNTILVHGCNAQHVMGAGIARIVKNKFPQAFYDYAHVSELILGNVYMSHVDGNRFIANAITQDGYGHDGVYASVVWIKDCLETVKQLYPAHRIIMPEIGCGLGGLTTEEVFPVVEEVFDGEQVCVVYSLKKD